MVEISKKNFIMIVSLSFILGIGFLISIIYNQPIVSIVLLSVAFIGAFYLAWKVRIKKSVYIDPKNIKILGYRMNELGETKSEKTDPSEI